jgi:hypothetical protein
LVKEKPETEIDNYKYAFLAALGAGAAESASRNGGIATKIAKTTEIGVELNSASHGGHEGHKGFAAEFSILPSSQFSRYRSYGPSASPVSKNLATSVTSV